MIRHVVLVRFRADMAQAEIDGVFAALRRLKKVIPGIVGITTGANDSPEGLARGYTHGFTVDFDDATARDDYLPHPEHSAVGKLLVGAAEGGVDGILVLDYETKD